MLVCGLRDTHTLFDPGQEYLLKVRSRTADGRMAETELSWTAPVIHDSRAFDLSLYLEMGAIPLDDVVIRAEPDDKSVVVNLWTWYVYTSDNRLNQSSRYVLLSGFLIAKKWFHEMIMDCRTMFPLGLTSQRLRISSSSLQGKLPCSLQQDLLKCVVINSNGFAGGTQYTFSAVGTSADGTKAFARMSLVRPLGPSNGKCELESTKHTGLYLISCKEFDGTGGPVSFSLAFSFNRSSQFKGITPLFLWPCRSVVY